MHSALTGKTLGLSLSRAAIAERISNLHSLSLSSFSNLSRDVLKMPTGPSRAPSSSAHKHQPAHLGPGWETHWIRFLTISPDHDLNAPWQQ